MPLSRQQILREIKGLRLQNKPLNLTAVKRRNPDLIKQVYQITPFWGWKQALQDAGIDYTNINTELEDTCECLICGGEGVILTSHLLNIHNITPKEYREQFPGAELMAETTRVARMRAHKALPHWEPVWSWEYVLDRAWEFYERGWPLSVAEVMKKDRPMFNYVWINGRKWEEVLSALGLDPAAFQKTGSKRPMTKREVIMALKQRRKEGKRLTDSAVSLEDMRLYNAARRKLGSFNQALQAAGIEVRKHRITNEDLEALKAEMKRVAGLKGEESMNAARALKDNYTSMVFSRLGNWEKACKRFGVRVEDLAYHRYATREHVIDRLKEWAEVEGANTQQIEREDRLLMLAAYRLFGSWSGALKVAGVKFARKRRASIPGGGCL